MLSVSTRGMNSSNSYLNWKLISLATWFFFKGERAPYGFGAVEKMIFFYLVFLWGGISVISIAHNIIVPINHFARQRTPDSSLVSLPI